VTKSENLKIDRGNKKVTVTNDVPTTTSREEAALLKQLAVLRGQLKTLNRGREIVIKQIEAIKKQLPPEGCCWLWTPEHPDHTMGCEFYAG
jgi:hypothetical protein